MKNIYIIAMNTVKEIQRHNILYVLLILLFFIVVSGFVLGSLSLNEQTRLSINFTFTACHICLVLISIYFSSVLISKEIQTKTIFTLLTKPISRMEFILGKFLGLSYILLWVTGFLTILILGVYFFYQQSINSILFIAMFGMFLEALILTAVGFLFSHLTSSFGVIVYTIFIFIIAHSVNGIKFVLNQNQTDSFLSSFMSVIINAVPNLEKINWRAHALYQDPLIKGEWFFSSLYSFSWVILLLVMTGILFQRRSIV